MLFHKIADAKPNRRIVQFVITLLSGKNRADARRTTFQRGCCSVAAIAHLPGKAENPFPSFGFGPRLACQDQMDSRWRQRGQLREVFNCDRALADRGCIPVSHMLRSLSLKHLRIASLINDVIGAMPQMIPN